MSEVTQILQAIEAGDPRAAEPQAAAGATIAARLLPADLANLRREAEQAARSVRVQKP